MGRQIIKVDRETDLYVEWSSIVEAPTLFGTRKKMLRYLVEDYAKGTDRRKLEKQEAKKRLDRADQHGSSGRPPFGCTWDDHGEIFMQRGTLLRTNMKRFVELHFEAAGSDENIPAYSDWPQELWDQLMALLEKFEDDDELRTSRR